MRLIYKLNGLDCVNCANKIEKSISKIKGIENVTVNFLTTKLSFDLSDDDIHNIFPEVSKIVKKIDSNIIIKEA